MKKTLLALILLLCASVCSAPAAPPAFDSSGTNAAAVDSVGTVWVMPDGGIDGRIKRWRNGIWAETTVPGTAGCRLQCLARGADGAVYTLWQKTQEWQKPVYCLVTVQRGISSRILARFDGPVVHESGYRAPTHIYAAAGGDLWVTGSLPTLWRIAPNGVVQTFPLSPTMYAGGKLPGEYETQVISSVVDSAGRRWSWESQAQNGTPPNGLRGVLIWNGRTLEHHPTLTGLSDRSLTMIAPLDADHLWLSEVGNYYDPSKQDMTYGGLYRVDIHTLAAVPEPSPAPGTFQNVTQIFSANGDWYTVDGSQNNGPAVLWRRRAGVWRKIVDTLEAPGSYYAASGVYPWLAEPTGVWLGVSGGAWWLPRDSSPVLFVNWRRGLPVQTVTGLFPLPNGRLFAADSVGNPGSAAGTSGAEMPPVPQPIRPLPPGVTVGGLGAPQGLGPLLADTRHHLWSAPLSYTGRRPLDEWVGKRWRIHLPPNTSAEESKTSTYNGSGLYACDSLGRVWSDLRSLYDPRLDTWTNYATVQDALTAAVLPGMSFLPHPSLYQPPVFSGDGRVAYTPGGTEISFYDGKQWRRWQSADIMGKNYGGNMPGPPHFNSAGRLEVVLDTHVCEWTPENGWQQAGTQKSVPYVSPVPPGGPEGLSSNPVTDDTGVKWFAWSGAVYAAGYGKWVKQAALSAPGSPFRFGYGIDDALHDPAGRLFFVSRPAGRYDCVVWSPPPVLRPTLSVTPLSDEGVRVKFGAKSAEPHWVRWRLNGGAWSAPTTDTTLTLTTQARGEYRLEAETLDSRLQLSPPVSAVWRISVMPDTQISRWVRALLSGPDPARETAIAGLVKQPAAALPALKAARPGASDTGRWWIDAATQQVQAAADAGVSAAGRE